MADLDPTSLLAIAETAATGAASLIAEAVGQTQSVDTKSSRTDMVTATDRASEAYLVERIVAARPDDAILGEEGAARPGTSGVRWVIDPLDGTTNFLYGIPAFAVSIGIEVDGVPTVGVVVDVSRQETFTGVRGGGAWLDGRALRCSTCSDLGTALVGTGFGYDAGRRARQGAALAQVVPLVRDVRRVGSAALDLCWAAAGRLDAYFERGLQPWDLIGGAVVATEAGAILGDLAGGPPSGDFVLAAPPPLFEPLRALLASVGADEG
jgi:myo-inositol-1(or 4)-monophosphatase